MDVKNPNKIKFKEREDVRASFQLENKGQLVVLTDKRIYFAGTEKKGFMKKRFGVHFVNLDSIIAGSRSKSKTYWPLIFVFLFGLVGALGIMSAQMSESVPQLQIVSDLLGSNTMFVGIGGAALAFLFLMAFMKSTRKVIVLNHMGGEELVLPMNGKSDEEINSYLEIIADGIDG